MAPINPAGNGLRGEGKQRRGSSSHQNLGIFPKFQPRDVGGVWEQGWDRGVLVVGEERILIPPVLLPTQLSLNFP